MKTSAAVSGIGLAQGDRQLIDAQPGQVGVPAGRQEPEAVGGGLERGGLGPPGDGERIGGVGRELVGADVDRAVDDPDESGAALIGGQGLTGGGIDGQGVAALVDGRAAGQECDGLGRPAVVGERAEPGVGDADLVAVDAVDQAAGAAGADQVVRAGAETTVPADVAGRGPLPVPRCSARRSCCPGWPCRGDIQPAARAAAGDVVVGDGGVGDRLVPDPR